MIDERRPARNAAATIAAVDVTTAAGPAMMLAAEARAAMVCALEAFEDGDQRHAAVILLAALEEESVDRRTPYACRMLGCPNAYRWPGLRDRHEGLAHGRWPA